MTSSFNINEWLEILLAKLRSAYGERLLFVGHTGSWVRGEARPESDIDVNVILDQVHFEDILHYRELVAEMPDHEKACGFICSREEIQAWPKNDLFHFINGCKVLHGGFEGLVPTPSRQDLIGYIKTATSMLLHGARHSVIYSQDLVQEVHNLEMAYKISFFILQVWVFLTENRYVLTKKEMLAALADPSDQEVLRVCLAWGQLGSEREAYPQRFFSQMVAWSSSMLLRATRLEFNL